MRLRGYTVMHCHGFSQGDAFPWEPLGGSAFVAPLLRMTRTHLPYCHPESAAGRRRIHDTEASWIHGDALSWILPRGCLSEGTPWGVGIHFVPFPRDSFRMTNNCFSFVTMIPPFLPKASLRDWREKGLDCALAFCIDGRALYFNSSIVFTDVCAPLLSR